MKQIRSLLAISLLLYATPQKLAGCQLKKQIWPALRRCFAGCISIFSFGPFPILKASRATPIMPEKNGVKLPTFDDWCTRCSNISSYNALIKEFNVEISAKSDITTDEEKCRKMCQTIMMQSKIQWNEIDTVIKAFTQQALHSDLYDASKWIGGKTLPDTLLNDQSIVFNGKREPAAQGQGTRICPFIMGIKVPVNAKLYLFGDLHGDVRSPVKMLQKLQEEGVMDSNDGYIIKDRDTYIIGGGDYVDRGITGIETLTTLLILALKNPHQVILVRGNHEDAGLGGNIQCFQREVEYKFPTIITRENILDRQTQKIIKEGQRTDGANRALRGIAQVYNAMPVAVFIGCGDSVATNYLLATHASPDIRFNPENLFETLRTKELYERVYEHYPIKNAPYPHLKNNETRKLNLLDEQATTGQKLFLQNKTSRLSSEDIDFMYGYIHDQEKDKNRPYFISWDARIRSYGQPLVSTIFDDWQLVHSPSWWQWIFNRKTPVHISKLHCIFRGHQHRSARDISATKNKNSKNLSIMKDLWENNGIAEAWNYSKKKGTPHIPHRSLFTLLASPDNEYGSPSSDRLPSDQHYYPGYNYAAWAKVTAGDRIDNWLLEKITLETIPAIKHMRTPNRHEAGL